MSQYFGKTISLVSNKGLRYVGLLDKISAEDATVSLKSVRSFGTEGRMAQQGQPTMEVLPGSDVYDYVVFRGSDVKDLSVLDVPIELVQPQPYYPPTAQNAPAPTPTAIQQQQPAHVAAQVTADQPSVTAAAAAAPAAPAPVAAAPTHTQRAPATPPAAASTTAEERPSKTASAVDAQPGAAPVARQAPQTELYNTAFDFEEANARFEKEKHDAAAPVYDRKSLFFDSISLNDRNSMRWSEEKTLNMNTFGETSVRRGRGNHRGRGRGRGGNRGRGRRTEPKPEWA